MNATKTALILIALAVFAGNCNGQNKMTNEQLDNICREMSDESRAKVLNQIADKDRDADRATSHWFPAYLDITYNTTNASEIQINEKRLNKNKLVRITEGSFRIEVREDRMKEKYRIPTEMNETEYFFLNGELVKISITKGYTDYNALPYNYWFRIHQLDLMFKKNKLVKKAEYIYFGQWDSSSKVSDEWIETFGIDEDTLIKRAYILNEKVREKDKQ